MRKLFFALKWVQSQMNCIFKFFIVLLFVSVFSNSKAQLVSDINVIGGLVFYQYSPAYGKSKGGKGSFTTNSSMCTGVGIKSAPFAKNLRAEYNLIYFNDKTLINYQNEPEGRSAYSDHTLQNQFLLLLSDKHEVINLRLGFVLDIVAFSTQEKETGSQSGENFIQAGEGNLRKYHMASGLLGLSIGKRVKFALDYIPSFSSKFFSGEFERISSPGYFWGSPDAWYKRDMGSVSLIFRIPTNIDRP